MKNARQYRKTIDVLNVDIRYTYIYIYCIYLCIYIYSIYIYIYTVYLYTQYMYIQYILEKNIWEIGEHTKSQWIEGEIEPWTFYSNIVTSSNSKIGSVVNPNHNT